MSFIKYGKTGHAHAPKNGDDVSDEGGVCSRRTSYYCFKIRKNDVGANEFFLDIGLSPLYYSKVLFVSGSSCFF
jgi:hypothetical protein